jgi:hypothetical protein
MLQRVLSNRVVVLAYTGMGHLQWLRVQNESKMRAKF